MTTHTTIVTIDGKDIEVELELSIAPAERDVGIMSDYIDDWSVTAVAGDTDKAVCQAITDQIIDEYGDEGFVDKLYNEDAADVSYDDYPEYDD